MLAASEATFSGVASSYTDASKRTRLITWFSRSRNHEPPMFVLRHAGGAQRRFAIYSEVVPRDLLHKYAWFLGRPLPVEPRLPLVFQQSEPESLYDYLLTNTSGFLISKRLFAITQTMSTCARGYDAVIVRDGETLSTDYVAVNFECSWSCMNRSKSRVGLARNGSIDRIYRLRLDPVRIPAANEIFRLGEFPVMLLATPKFKAAIEQAGISGIEFLDSSSDKLL